MVSLTAPLSSTDAWLNHSSKWMPRRSRVERIWSRMRAAAHRPASSTTSAPS